jgi:hypothetical protein
MDFTDLVNLAGELENPLGSRGFTGVDVGENADVPVGVKVSHLGIQSKK